MKVRTPCSTKGCKAVHTSFAAFRHGEKYTAPAEPCFACAEKKERNDAADEFVNQKRKTK